MTTTANIGAMVPRPSRPRAAATRAPRGAMLHPVRLDHGDIVRIVDGQGTLLHARSGVLWITHERNVDDIVLHPSRSYRIPHGGTTIVEAHRGARIVIEVPRGVRRPQLVDVAFLGRAARPVPLAGGLARGWVERARLAIARLLDPTPWPLSDAHERSASRRRPSSERHDAEAFTPEAVRDRLLRASPYPYY